MVWRAENRSLQEKRNSLVQCFAWQLAQETDSDPKLGIGGGYG